MKKIILILTAALAAACMQEETLPTEQTDKVLIHADIEHVESKTSLSSANKILWETDDMVAIFDRSTLNTPYKVAEGTEGKSSCDLEYADTESDDFIGGTELTHRVGFYPYSTDIECEPEQNGGYIITGYEIEATQTYRNESFSNGTFPMVAVSSSDQLSFKNICGAIMIQLKGEATVKSISLSGNNNEILGGPAIVKAYPGATPSIEMGNGSVKTVTLDCGAGVSLSPDKATEFIIVVPPTTFNNGFSIQVTDTEGETYSKNTYAGNTVSRSSLLVMPVVTTTGEGGEDDTPIVIQHEGLQYVWDESVIPEITLHVSLDEWNKLLGYYDANPNTKNYVKCNVTFKKGDEVTEIIDAGMRLRGNTSRRRPEAGSGNHVANKADWQHCHFGINLRKFNKDNDAIEVKDIKGIRKFNLKWFKDDACYVREVFSYDLFRRAGVWTAANDIHCRLWVHVEGDSKPAYYGVYEMIEPYDNKYVEKREHLYGNAGGNLWKCSYPAFLDTFDGVKFGEDDNINEYTYELKESEKGYASAYAQLEDFMLKLQGKGDESFYKWIKEVCDVEFLLRTYAVNVALGMWDDMWNNGNNYYLYFNSTDMFDYKVYLIPYDYDNTLGTSNCYDAAKQDPYNWGSRGLLMQRIMKFEEFRNIYRDELKRLVDPANGLMDATTAVNRIKAWQTKIQDYLINDTGEDMYIEDKPASWGSWGNYKLMDWSNNYFVEKANTIKNMN